jgi:Tfp pilus assembly protein PilF
LAADKALKLDDDLAEAHTALALYEEQYAWNWEGAEREFKRAISANPNYATAHQWYGEFLGFMGRTEESIGEVEKAVQLDPLSLSTNTARAFPYLAARQYDRAIEKLEQALEMEADFPLALYYLGRSYAGGARYKEAVVQYKKAIVASGKSTYFISALVYALAKGGQKTEADKAFAQLIEISKERPVSRYVLARSLAALGNKERALDELEKAFKERDSLMIVMRIDQNFDEIRDELRFQEIMRKMNLSH